MSREGSDSRRPRLGAVSYLNSKPLVEDLAQLCPEYDIRLDYPSALARDLANGELDVALVPSIEYFRQPGCEIVSDACVAARGPVLSVKLYSRVPLADLKTLALDEGSRTSATLVRVLLAERFGVVPELSPLPLNRPWQQSSAQAMLVIGDRAISAPRESFPVVWDLGQEWWDWTGLPFVFAMWVARHGLELNGLEDRLSEARDRGEARLEEIAAREAPQLDLPVEVAVAYLRRNLYFRLNSAERRGLQLFHELAAGLDLAPREVDLVFRSCARS